jgi:hypothetical protein
VDYIDERWGRRLGAVHTPEIDGVPRVRLIDNVAVSPNPAPRGYPGGPNKEISESGSPLLGLGEQ